MAEVQELDWRWLADAMLMGAQEPTPPASRGRIDRSRCDFRKVRLRPKLFVHLGDVAELRLERGKGGVLDGGCVLFLRVPV